MLRRVQIAAAELRDHQIVFAHAFVGGEHVAHHLIAGGQFLFLRLIDRVIGARDFALVAIEDGELEAAEERGCIGRADVVVIGGAGDVHLAVGLGQFILALGRDHALLRGAKIRAVLQGFGLQVFEFHLHRHVIEVAGNVEIFRHSFVSQKLPQADQRLHFG